MNADVRKLKIEACCLIHEKFKLEQISSVSCSNHAAVPLGGNIKEMALKGGIFWRAVQPFSRNPSPNKWKQTITAIILATLTRWISGEYYFARDKQDRPQVMHEKDETTRVSSSMKEIFVITVALTWWKSRQRKQGHFYNTFEKCSFNLFEIWRKGKKFQGKWRQRR